jgi:hypothetical protein
MGNTLMKRIGHVLLIFSLLISFPWIAVASNDAPTGVSQSDKDEILQVARALIRSILNEDIHALSRLVSTTEGLTCTDTQYSHKEVISFLKNKKSYLYLGLYDSKGYLHKCGDSGYPPEYPPISEKEFLLSANQTMTVNRLDNDWAEVIITSPLKTHYPRSWSFHREGGSWRVAGGSFIIGNCTCG